MGFADVLKLYLDKTKCTAKELSTASGVSASALSRYRSGKRIPEPEQIEKLICGFVQLARSAVRKIESYQKNEIYPGDRLILTFETEQSVLNSNIIERLVNKYL